MESAFFAEQEMISCCASKSATRGRARFANQEGLDVSEALEALEWRWVLISDAVLFDFIL